MFIFIVFVCAFINGGYTQNIIVRHLHIISEIQSRFAITDVLSLIENAGQYPQEVTFTAQLPEEAFISNFSMKIDGKHVVGEVKEKEKAKREYEAAKARGESTGLVAQRPRETSIFQINIFVAPRGQVEFNLTYQEILKRVHGVYKHVVNIQPEQEVEDIQVDVLIAENGKISTVHVPEFTPNAGQMTNRDLLDQPKDGDVTVRTSHETYSSLAYVYFDPGTGSSQPINGQLVVLYDVERRFDGGDIEVLDGYFVHFVAPQGIPPGNKHVVFVIDKSGSMQGRKFKQTKKAMTTILDDLDSSDYFNVIMFSNKAETWQTNSQRAASYNKDDAKRFVEDSKPYGATNIYDSLLKALEMIDSHNGRTLVDMVIFLTDGRATESVKDNLQIVDDITDANRKDASIFGIAFGNDADYELMQDLADNNNGLARRIYFDSDAAVQLDGFYQEIATPLLKQVQVLYKSGSVDISSLIRTEDDLFFDGSEIQVVGKVDNENRLESRVIGDSRSGRIKLPAKHDVASDNPRCYPQPQVGSERKRPLNVQHIPLCLSADEPNIVTTPRPLLAGNTLSGFIERMWAYLTIKKLLAESKKSSTTREDAAANKQRALELSIKYNFVTELTSMVVVDPRDTRIKRRLTSTGEPLSDTLGPQGTQSLLKPHETKVKNNLLSSGEITKAKAKATTPSSDSKCNPDVLFLVDMDGSRNYKSQVSRTLQTTIIRMSRDDTMKARFAFGQLRKDRDIALIHKFKDNQNARKFRKVVSRGTRTQKTGGDLDKMIKILKQEAGKTKIVVLMTGSKGLGEFKKQITKLQKNGVKVTAASVDQPFGDKKIKELSKLISDSSLIIDGADDNRLTDTISTLAKCF